MFNSSHTLVGLALARTGLDRWCPHAAITAVIASNLPDIDIATLFHGNPAYIEYHRGITHAILGMPVLSALLSAAMFYSSRLRRSHKFSGNFWKTFTVALLAMSTHPLLDYMNTYGIRPFLPFDGTWFYGDLLFVIDPIFDSVLALSLVAGLFSKRFRRHLAIGSLLLVVAYVSGQRELRNLSRSHLVEFEKAMVSPAPLSPFRWLGLIDRPGEVTVVDIHPFRGIRGQPDRMLKEPSSEVIRKAAQTQSGAVFFRFARFPVVRVQTLESGYSVTLIDARFYRSASSTAFAARIVLDSSLNVLDESLGFNQYVD
ncbi:MAG: metal-dependent hydrolase [Acidobacteria bacterium]|nr:metal-dependent hydrolase [Acidobacteriota bacterium]